MVHGSVPLWATPHGSVLTFESAPSSLSTRRHEALGLSGELQKAADGPKGKRPGASRAWPSGGQAAVGAGDWTELGIHIYRRRSSQGSSPAAPLLFMAAAHGRRPEMKQGQPSPRDYVWSTDSEDRVGPQASWGPWVPSCHRSGRHRGAGVPHAEPQHTARPALAE